MTNIGDLPDEAGAAVPATPEADDKDWTWVLQRPCAECGFDANRLETGQIAVVVRRTALVWQEVLADPEVRRRPSPTVWSPLEYGAHCRDVYELFGARARLMLHSADPQFANWDQDVTALEKRYWESDPEVVSSELAAWAASAAEIFDAVADDEWARTGRRSNGSIFTVETLGKYFVHDLVHHLHDVGSPLPPN